jgi:hypothetical protein
MRLFSLDLTATDAVELMGLPLRGTNKIYQRIRTRMAQACAATLHFTSELETNYFHFVPKRMRGKQGVAKMAARPFCLAFPN